MKKFKKPTGPRLLLLAHSCNPESGSEPGAGWNRALQAAKEFSTWVICDSETNRAPIDHYLATHGPIPNLQFVYVLPSRFEQALRKLPGMFYAAYNLWQRRAYRLARDLHQQYNFDLVHQVNWCGFREPGYCWKLDAPFIWGPVGGAQNYPWRFLPSAGCAGAAGEILRSLLNAWQMRFSWRVGLAARKAAAMLAANTTNARALSPRRRTRLQTMLEIGAPPRSSHSPRDFHRDGPLRILWSGVFEHRKALHLLLQAVAALPPEISYELRILGRGPLEKRWRRIAARLGVESNCRWLGWLDQPLALAQYDWADVFAFTSLRDTTGTVVLESLAAGTPIVCLDHQGVADVVTDECGVKVPVTNPREVVKRLCETFVQLHLDREELAKLSAGAVQRAEYYAWDRQGRRMAEVYHEVLKTRAPSPGVAPPGFAVANAVLQSIQVDADFPVTCGTASGMLTEPRA